jgi:2-pyrone-4,6-dicarboxylate lactonase
MSDAEFPSCAPYDPNPRRPVLRAPPGTCDCHAHVFGPEARYPYSPKRGYTPPDAPFEAYRRMHETLGIERGVLTQPSVYGTDNRAIIDAVARDPENLRAVAAVDADISDGELRRLDDTGVRGVRINLVDKGGMPFATFADFERFASRIADLGWHVEFLVHVHEFPDLAPRFRALPVDSVVGHLGYMRTSEGLDHPGFRQFLDLVAEGRCWVKLSGAYRVTTLERAPYKDVAPFARALIEARPDRMLWGTDWPHPICKIPMPNDGDLLDLLLDWSPDEATRRRILVDNPARLYGFG